MVNKSRQLIRKWVILIALLPFVVMLLMCGIHPLLWSLGYRLVFYDYGEFIDLSIQNPKDKKTGIELVSVWDGKATVKIRGRLWDLNEDDRSFGHARRIRLIYASQEKGEAVLEKMYSGSRYERPDSLLGKVKKDRPLNKVLEQRGWLCICLSTNRFWSSTGLADTNFGIEIISFETNGVIIRLSGSGKELYSRKGGYFDINNSIKGVDRLQVIDSSAKDKRALLRLIRNHKK